MSLLRAGVLRMKGLALISPVGVLLGELAPQTCNVNSMWLGRWHGRRVPTSLNLEWITVDCFPSLEQPEGPARVLVFPRLRKLWLVKHQGTRSRIVIQFRVKRSSR